MAQETQFFERKIDRTAYRAFWFVGIATLVVWVVMAWAIWQLGTFVQRHHWSVQIPNWHFSIPKPGNILNSAQQKANQAASQAEQSAATNAENSAKSAASAQLNQFLHQ